MIRPATPADVPVVLALIKELAAYEREPDAVVATEATLSKSLFGPEPKVFCLVAEDDAGAVAGFALWFFNFSTWLGQHGVYLEDLFVRPEARRLGLGRALLGELARIAVANGCGRLDWAVLDWNEPAQGFYRSLGATPMDEWTGWRLTGDALLHLASRSSTVRGERSSIATRRR